jgi:hypothetical protein
MTLGEKLRGHGRTWCCTYCPDAGVRAELDRVPWPRRPRGSGSAQLGRQSSHEAHAARRRLHVASGAAADGASARARAHATGHAARDCPDGACRYAAQPGHHSAAAAATSARRSTGRSRTPQQAPIGASGSATRKGGRKRLAGALHHAVRLESVPAGRQDRAEEAHGERLGKNREGLTAGPHAEVSEREEKWAADTWDHEGAGVHLAVAYREGGSQRSGLAIWIGSGRVRPVKKEIDFENSKLFSIQRRTENNSKEIDRCL